MEEPVKAPGQKSYLTHEYKSPLPGSEWASCTESKALQMKALGWKTRKKKGEK